MDPDSRLELILGTHSLPPITTVHGRTLHSEINPART